MPEPIVHWGHPIMMSIVVLFMGTYVVYTGWRARLTLPESEESQKSKTEHRKIAPLMFLFLATGYTGGILSLVIQKQAIFESPHFWTGSIVILFLSINSLLALLGLKGPLRSAHAYIGSLTAIVLIVHFVLGLRLGFSI
jgi:hypothetical protein